MPRLAKHAKQSIFLNKTTKKLFKILNDALLLQSLQDNVVFQQTTNPFLGEDFIQLSAVSVKIPTSSYWLYENYRDKLNKAIYELRLDFEDIAGDVLKNEIAVTRILLNRLVSLMLSEDGARQKWFAVFKKFKDEIPGVLAIVVPEKLNKLLELDGVDYDARSLFEKEIKRIDEASKIASSSVETKKPEEATVAKKTASSPLRELSLLGQQTNRRSSVIERNVVGLPEPIELAKK